MHENTLYYGDNLHVLQQHIHDESVDLIYLDPPFNSNAKYNVLFKNDDSSKAPAQIEAFDDTWTWNQESESIYEKIVEEGDKQATFLHATRQLLGTSNMMAYLVMMMPRLIELRRALKPTGSIYLHCDPTASHYLKLLMDSVFGGQNFQNEIIWSYNTGGVSSEWFGKKHDVIFVYNKTSNHYFDPPLQQSFVPSMPEPHTPSGKKYGVLREKTCSVCGVGSPGQKYRLVTMRDVWNDVNPLFRNDQQRLGYPTQKPLALLERIIQSSCPEDGVVLDPFCGCGTTIDAAQNLGRKWIGIDITHLAINLIKHRINDIYATKANFKVVGEPQDLDGAKELAKDNQYQFQYWALGLVGARPAPNNETKGADRGIDGIKRFHEQTGGETKSIIISVKSGKVTSAYVRDLVGVVEREKAAMGVLLTLNPATKEMKIEAASGGFYRVEGAIWGNDYPKIQILTIEELLDGKRIDMPTTAIAPNTTFQKATRTQPKQTKDTTIKPSLKDTTIESSLFDEPTHKEP